MVMSVGRRIRKVTTGTAVLECCDAKFQRCPAQRFEEAAAAAAPSAALQKFSWFKLRATVFFSEPRQIILKCSINDSHGGPP